MHLMSDDAEIDTTRTAQRLARDRVFLGAAGFYGPAMGKIRDASLTRRSARPGFTGRAESLAGREVSEPVQIANEGIDLSAELKRGLSYVRTQRKKVA